MKPGLLGCLILILAIAALAHRLDEYLQATRIRVAHDRVELSIDLTPGVAVADQVLAVIDQNRDGRFSDAERAVYAQNVLEDFRITLDERQVPLRLADSSFPTLKEVKGGLGVIRIMLPPPSAHWWRAAILFA